MGLRQAKTAIQSESMDDDLRAGLWNVFSPIFVEPLGSGGYYDSRIQAQDRMKVIWDEFFRLPADVAPGTTAAGTSALRPLFLQEHYIEVYDLVDFTVQRFGRHYALEKSYNKVLEREVSGFRFVSAMLVPISNEHELDAIESGLAVGGRLVGASNHLQAALRLLSDRDAPDYRNSVKESISAVESAARAISGKPKATLGDLLPALESKGYLHGAQREAFSRLYGYTSDAGGIRHAMTDEPSVTFADAKYMLAVCAAFVAYLQAVA